MPDYAKTIIYKIVCKDINITKSYGGHTTHIIKRRQHHKCDCNNINSKKYNIYLYQFIRENGGWDNWEMLWCYDFPCKNKREAELEERIFIEKEKCELNSARPYVSEDEKKQYYEDNKDKIKESNKNYKENNKDKIKESNKNYKENNKSIINEKAKDYRENNKTKINEKAREKIKCECGCEITKSGLSTHKKSAKHKKLMV